MWDWATIHVYFEKNTPSDEKKILGLDLLAQFVSIGLMNEPSSLSVDPIAAELEAVSTKSIIALNCEGGEGTEHEQKEIGEEDTLEKSKEDGTSLVNITWTPD